MAITSKLIGARGRKQAEKLGIDPSRVPPGQYLTEKVSRAHAEPQPEVRP
jgi:hypothetical protein